MKVIEASNKRLIIQIQRYKAKPLDFSNNLNEILGWLTLPVWLSVLWYQSESFDKFKNTFIIALTVVVFLVGGGLIYSLLYQKDNFYEIDSYVFNRELNLLSARYKSIWGEKQQEICSLNDVSGIHLEILSETFPRETTPDHPPTELKTAYQVKLKLVSEKEITLEYNSISSFSSDEVQNAFRGLITETDDVIKEVPCFLEIT